MTNSKGKIQYLYKAFWRNNIKIWKNKYRTSKDSYFFLKNILEIKFFILIWAY